MIITCIRQAPKEGYSPKLPMVKEVVGLSEEGLPKDVADEFFEQKEKMKKEKEEKEREAAEKRGKISETLEKHIEEKGDQSPPSE